MLKSERRFMHVNNPQINDRHMLYIFIVCSIICLVFTRNVFVYALPISPIILGLIAIGAFFLREREIIAIALSFTVMTSAFQYKYAILIIVLASILKNQGRFRRTGLYIPIIMIMIWEMLHAFIGIFSILEYFRGFSELILLLYLSSIDKEKLDYKLTFRTFSCCTIAIGLIRLYIQISQYGFNTSMFWNDFYRFGELDTALSSYGLSSNENTWGFVCALSAASMVLLIRKKEYRALDIMLLIASVIFGALSISRTYIILIIFILFSYLLTTVKDKKRALRGVLGIVVLVVAVFFILKNAFPTVIANFVMRLSLADFSGSRIDLFEFYNMHIFSKPEYTLFGIGQQNILQKLQSIYPMSVLNVPHNGIQETLIMWGLPGLTFLISLLICMYREGKVYMIERQYIQMLPFGLVMIDMLLGQFFRNGVVMMAMCYGYIAMFYMNTSLDNNGGIAMMRVK